MKEKYNFKFDKNQIRTMEEELKALSAEKVLKRLETSSGPTIIEGNFRITILDDKYYKCLFSHPVNEYLPQSGNHIEISALLPKNEIESFVSGNYAQSIGKTIPLRIYGEVWAPIDRTNKVYELQITPLAVY